MRGVFVSNAYLRGEKFSEPGRMLSAAAEELDVTLDLVTNADLRIPIGDRVAAERALGDADFVLFWDKDVRLAANLEVCGFPVFNSAQCISVCDDKCLTHLVLANEGVPSIDTVSCPMSFSEYDDLSFLESAADTLGFPMVVKDCFGSFGQQVHLARDMDSLEGMFAGPYRPRILQRYIECSGSDIRLEVVGDDVVEAVRRHGAADAVGADFCGVDVIVSEDGPVVCEVNSNAHIRNLYECTGRDVSYDILLHIIDAVG